MTRREFTSILAGAGAILPRSHSSFAHTGVEVASDSRPYKSEEGNAAVADYCNPQLTIEQRTADLLRRMTLEEKVEQLRGGRTPSYGVRDTTGRFMT